MNERTDNYLVSAPDYAVVMNETVLPELEKIREDRIISGKGGISLFCSVFPAEKPVGTVLIVHGFTESIYKYSELIYSLVHQQFTVVAYDQRGHGRSGRAKGLPHPSVTHVDRFEDYVEDLEIICDIVLNNCPKPWSILAHSMGGAVTALYLEKHHDTFSSAVLCSPMISPNVGDIPPIVVKSFCTVACLFGREKQYPFFMKPYSGPEAFESSCATDPARFTWYDAEKAAKVELQNSVPSYRWVKESIAVTGKILSPGAPESISCPVLLSAADMDTAVMPEPQKAFIARVPKGRYLFVKGTRHEIFRSPNKDLIPWWNEVLAFLKEEKE